MTLSLIQKYNVPGPRYTSYPTVPYWDDASFDVTKWKQSVLQSFDESNAEEGLSLYIHLPFCESLCTFCGCHKRITKRHEVEAPYIDALLKEWQLYLELFPKKPHIREIHLGGGTPTFFSPLHLKKLIDGILESADVAPNYEFSFEGHPSSTSRAHLKTLFDLGFRRVSFGVQDYSPTVQNAINRHQSFHDVAKVTFWAREIGYTSVSHDLIYGLPFQKMDDVLDTIDKTRSLKPDRLAFYSYAHVPWMKGNGQRGFNDADVPKDDEKRALYEAGKQRLLAHQYVEIGMDHFALPTDDLYQSFTTGNLHRNFMGYSSTHTKLLIGLGVSSISDSWYAFAQNEKQLEAYYSQLDEGEFPVFRGHTLTTEDLVVRRHILNLMCRYTTSWTQLRDRFAALPEVLDSLAEMQQDGLIQIESDSLTILEAGKPFIRNVCMAFDLRLKRDRPTTPLFSMTI
ncbi:MAG: oxygen-independent coproporphyrinogen III oxidase [Flavobacterium sp. BFFFF2]|nr:MAG: oxygen-independent coproporphyrinogen III oxidase [Flavobacterium sp. BFFFF2]